MPRQNRVTPDGHLVAVRARGTVLGNRGVLHAPDGRLVRTSQLERWICCALEFRGRWRPVMAPGRWTELFFLDEETALAAGHRPCAECRRPAFEAFRSAWGTAQGVDPPRAPAMDAALVPLRLQRDGSRPVGRAAAGELPDGAMIRLDGAPWLVHGARLRRWTVEGYADERALPDAAVDVLTPAPTVAALAAGYRAGVHPSAG